MKTVLRNDPSGDGGPPNLYVLCSCGRRYWARCYPCDLRRYDHCRACAPRWHGNQWVRGISKGVAFHKIKFSAVVEADPAAAREQLVAAFRKHKANRTAAAVEMGVSWITFSRWVDKLGLRAELEEIERAALREGWHHQRHTLSPGRPPVHGRRSKKRPRAA